MMMKLFRSKVWSPLDIGCLKWCCILFGMIAGAYFSDFTKRYVWIFSIAVILLAIKPIVSYFRNSEK
jgi:putative Mn2+ efflux pump MntP